MRDVPLAETLERPGDAAYMLDFFVPVDTPGGYVRAIFAMYGAPRTAADAFFADVSSAIRNGRNDLLMSEARLVKNALSAALATCACAESLEPLLQAELLALLANGRRAA